MLEPLEPRLLLDATATITTVGALPSSWAPGASSGDFGKSDYDHGVLLGDYAEASKPTYRFALPNPSISAGARQLTSLSVSVYGHGNYLYTAGLVIGSQSEPDLSVNEGSNTYSFSGSAARALLTPSGDGVTWFLDVTIDATRNYGLDWYDVRDVNVTYTYSGLSNDQLARLDQVVEGKQAIQQFYDFHMDFWQGGEPVWNQVSLGMQATLAKVGVAAIGGLIPGAWGEAIGALASEAFGAYVLPRLGGMASYNGLSGVLGTLSWWTTVSESSYTIGPFAPDTAMQTALQRLGTLGAAYESALVDGQFSSSEITSINADITQAADGIEPIWGEYGVGPLLGEMNRVYGGMSNGSGKTNAGKAALAYVDASDSLVYYSFQLGSGSSVYDPTKSYLSQYVSTLRAQSMTVSNPPATPVVFAKTSSSGSTISQNTWQSDDDPYFWWNPPASDLSIQGYSVAVDGSPDDSIDTSNPWWPIPSDGLSNGTHTFYAKAYSSAGWGGTGSFTTKVDDAAPTGSLSLASTQEYDGNAGTLDVGSIRITPSASDALSGISQMQWRFVGGSWSGWTSYSSSAFNATVPQNVIDAALASGRHVSVEIQYKDAAGNSSGSYSAYLTLRNAQSFVVTSLADVISNDGVMTLREALQGANTNAPVNSVPAGSPFEADTITFWSSLFVSGPKTITLGGTELAISDSLSLIGPGRDILTLNAAGLSRVMAVTGQGEVRLDGLNITGGNASCGAGIYLDGGLGHPLTLNITNSAIVSNMASGSGGGMLAANYYDDANVLTLNLTNTVLHQNSAGGSGGAIYADGYWPYLYVNLTGSTLTGNTAIDNGGGIYVGSSTVTLTDATLVGNSASSGGGIYQHPSWGGPLTLNNTIATLNWAWDINGSWSGSHNLIGVDAGFVRNPSPGADQIWGTADDDCGDLRLTAVSPAFNAGDNALAVDSDGSPLGTDIAGHPRVGYGTVDIGAYEYDGEAPAVVVNTLEDTLNPYDGVTSIREAIGWAGQAGLGNVITFNPSVTGGTILLDGSELQIDKPLTIDASGIDRIYS